MKYLILSVFISFLLCKPILGFAAEPIAIIVNKSNDTNTLTSEDLARIYKGQKVKWSDGKKMVVINRPVDLEIRRRFYKIILKSKPTKKFFNPGTPVPFKTLRMKSDLATCKFVARIPNAIGYVYLSEVNESIKVLNLDQKQPHDAGYQLH